MSFETTVDKVDSGNVEVRVKLQGKGEHTLTIRTSNLAVDEATKRVNLRAGETLVWRGRIEDQGTPWVAVIVPDGQLSGKQELSGTATL